MMVRIAARLIPAIVLLFFLVPGFTLPEDSITVSFPKSHIEINPHHAYSSAETHINMALYEGLVSFEPRTLAPIPAGASGWDIAPDGSRITIFLREDAAFSTGEPVTAHDFRESWLTLLDPEKNAEYSFLLDSIEGAFPYRTGQAESRDSVSIFVLSDTVLEVDLVGPPKLFLKVLAHPSLVPIHHTRRNRSSYDGRFHGAIKPVVGNGPYLIREISGDRRIVLEKNPHYWDADSVNIEHITVELIDDPRITTEMFNDGTLHWAASDFTMDTLSDLSSIHTNTLFSTSYLFFNARIPPYGDFRIRRALSLLVPWESVRKPSKRYSATSSLVPAIPDYPSVPGIDTVDRIRALAMLSESGFTNGMNLPNIRVVTTADSAHTRTAEALAYIWRRELAVDVSVEHLSYDRYRRRLENGDFTIAMMTWTGDYADPLSFLQMWRSDSNLNVSGYSSEVYDQLLKEAAAISEPKRYQALSEAEALLLDSAIVLPLFNASAINLVDTRRIGGWYENPLDIHPFKSLFLRAAPPEPGIAIRRGDRSDPDS